MSDRRRYHCGDHSASAGVDTVEPNFGSHVRADGVEGSEAVGCDFELKFDVENVVPLGDVELICPVLADTPELHLVEAVNLESAVEGFEGLRLWSEKADRESECRYPGD